MKTGKPVVLQSIGSQSHTQLSDRTTTRKGHIRQEPKEVVKNPPAVQETWVPSLGWEDALGWEEGKGYPLQYYALENSMDCIISPWGHKELDTTEQLSLSRRNDS